MLITACWSASSEQDYSLEWGLCNTMPGEMHTTSVIATMLQWCPRNFFLNMQSLFLLSMLVCVAFVFCVAISWSLALMTILKDLPPWPEECANMTRIMWVFLAYWHSDNVRNACSPPFLVSLSVGWCCLLIQVMNACSAIAWILWSLIDTRLPSAMQWIKPMLIECELLNVLIAWPAGKKHWWSWLPWVFCHPMWLYDNWILVDVNMWGRVCHQKIWRAKCRYLEVVSKHKFPKEMTETINLNNCIHIACSPPSPCTCKCLLEFHFHLARDAYTLLDVSWPLRHQYVCWMKLFTCVPYPSCSSCHDNCFLNAIGPLPTLMCMGR